ncbi:hypothetical protein DYB32_006123 [Aphanomyces invadans]|uniref:EF-hand domain-containing protein n=1 Tax=Aphanomyces invadans TaxID=157072 RepID=A0A3R6ZNJ0_9STRA|nr:hypothetical protein DYB32_006123 [Aphanomyces invadans]
MARRGFLAMPEFLQPSSLRKEHREKKIVPFTCQAMFDVVANVDAYVSFLPFCVSSRVVSRPSTNVMEADLTVGFQIFTESYRSRVELESPHRIFIKSIHSPTFKSIERYFFQTLIVSETSCEVNFRVSFEVGSILHAHAMRLFFDDVARVQLNAFIGQASKLNKLKQPKHQKELQEQQLLLHEPHHQQLVHTTPPPAREPLASKGKGWWSVPFLDGKVSAPVLAHLKHAFVSHATKLVEHTESPKLTLAGFGAACRDLVLTSPWAKASSTVADLHSISANSQSAVHMFQAIDTQHDGRLSPDELRRAMELRLRVVREVFPLLLQEQLALATSSSPNSSKNLNEEGMKAGLMAIESLMSQVEGDIPLAVRQVFLSMTLQEPNHINLTEWRRMWYVDDSHLQRRSVHLTDNLGRHDHPELVEMMTIDGMKKILRVATVVAPYSG